MRAVVDVDDRVATSMLVRAHAPQPKTALSPRPTPCTRTPYAVHRKCSSSLIAYIFPPNHVLSPSPPLQPRLFALFALCLRPRNPVSSTASPSIFISERALSGTSTPHHALRFLPPLPANPDILPLPLSPLNTPAPAPVGNMDFAPYQGTPACIFRAAQTPARKSSRLRNSNEAS